MELLGKTVSGMTLALLLTVMLVLIFNIQPVKTESATIVVPDDYPTIQEAVNNATDGDTIQVRAGTYYEHITIDKPLKLIGENRSNTIIDGNGTICACIKVEYTPSASRQALCNVCISEFTIRNGYWGIYIHDAQENNVTGNKMTDNQCGIHLFQADNNIITDNVVTKNSEGVTIGFSSGNTLVNNTVISNKRNFAVYGDYLLHFIHDVDMSNKVNGKSVQYLINQHNLTIDSTAFREIGYLGLINSTNVAVRNLNCNGILFAYTDNSMIQNVNVSSSVFGISLVHSFENIISGNTLWNNSRGINVYARPSFPTPFCNNMIINNVISDNDCGLLLDSCGNTIVNNTITSNRGTGMHLSYCERNAFKGNNIGGNRYNFVVEGGDLDDFVHDIDASNTVDGKPIYYWVTQDGGQIPADAGFVGVVNSTNITVKDLNLTNNSPNVLLAYTRDSTIENVTASNTRGGGSYNSGIQLYSSSDNVLINNILLNNEYGMYLTGGTNNKVTDNFVSSNDCGIYLALTCNNTIYHNNFVNNTFQVRVYWSVNTWDDGYPSGGNFWSDYEERYSNATEIDDSGIWNTPYVIDENNRDKYPIIPEFPSVPILPLFIALTVLVIVFAKKRVPRKLKT
jgi:parallel beta-helix repeat protein